MFKTILSLLVIGTGAICTKVVHAATTLPAMVVHQSFDYATERRVLVHLQARDHEGNPAANRMIEVAVPGMQGQVIERAITDEFGNYEGFVKLPGHIASVAVRVNLLGIANQAVVAVADGQVTHTFE